MWSRTSFVASPSVAQVQSAVGSISWLGFISFLSTVIQDFADLGENSLATITFIILHLPKDFDDLKPLGK